MKLSGFYTLLGIPKREVVFQPSIFRVELLVSGKVYLQWFFLSCVTS